MTPVWWRPDGFSDPLIGCDLGVDEAVVSRLVGAVAELRCTDPGRTRSNRGGWQSHARLHLLESFATAVGAIETLAATATGRLRSERPDGGCPNHGPPPPQRLVIGSLWANVSDDGSFNTPHHHDTSLVGLTSAAGTSPAGTASAVWLSGVLYLVAPDGAGPAIFHPCAGATDTTPVEIEPEVGRCLFFHPALLHEVRPGAADRVSLAFNLGAQPASATGDQPHER